MGRATRELLLRAGWWPRVAAGAAMRFRRGRVARVGRDPGRVGIVSVESDRGGGAGLVLGGGGARGAYASGALSVLLRELKDQVRVIVGTSAGALISAYLVANWHRPAEEAIEDGLSFWRELRFGDVFAPLMAPERCGSVHALRRRVSARQQPARPVDPAPRTASADARKAGRLRPAARERPRAAGGARGRRDPRTRQRVGRLSRGRDPATPRRSAARDRVRRDPQPRPGAYPGVLGDPGAVPGRARDRARAGGWLVLRRWAAPEHADQTGAVARGRAGDRDRAQLRRREPHATARAPAGLLRRGRAPAARGAGRPAGPGYPHAGQPKRADRGPGRRRGWTFWRRPCCTPGAPAASPVASDEPVQPGALHLHRARGPLGDRRDRPPRLPQALQSPLERPVRGICGCWERSSTAVPTRCTASF